MEGHGGGRLQSGEMSNAGGVLPWSIQQRSHTPPSLLMLVLTPEQPKALSASLADILASLYSFTFVSTLLLLLSTTLYSVYLQPPAGSIVCILYLQPKHRKFQRIATVLPPPPNQRPNVCLSRPEQSYHAGAAWTNLTHAARITPPPPFKISSSQFSFSAEQCIATRLWRRSLYLKTRLHRSYFSAAV